jgi:pimeloyl-ACP methyl ester carboxylesterase
VPHLGRVSVLDYVEDVHDCLRTLREGVVIGHSMGGLVAQKVAEAGRVRAAVFATSAPPKGIRAVTWPVLWRMPRYAAAIITSQPCAIGPEDAAALIGNR